ncbi:MAG: DNA polymerase III subunit gamma/tau [Bryobacterales bacterium]|nr:DNA polymerase III subunit gamma/tau [Bryobacterales bacterium]
MYQVIARKYRPQSFAELIGQEHVRTTLENAITQGRIAHGYIFSGQRGTGKTTVARILARCLNCVNGPTTAPCGECASCREIAQSSAVDVIEIDAASNRGINEMRELRENIRYRPARDRYKVFIVDEAHQITSEAFNALLKTLEEPPEWVIFLLCTTEAHKIPTTIASRCQQFSFRSVDFAEIVTRMEWIARQEGIETDAETLGVLAQAGEGSVRDSLSALDQAIACCGARLNASEVRALLGVFSLDTMGLVSEALNSGDSRRMIEIVQELERNGHNLQHFCRELARYFRNLLVGRGAGAGTRLGAASGPEQELLAAAAARFSEEDLTRYLQITLDLFRELQFSLQPRFHLELGLLKLVHAGKLLPIEQALAMLADEPAARPAAVSAPPPSPAAKPRVGPSPFAMDRERKSAPAPLDPADWRGRIHTALAELGMTFTADAVEHSEVTESGGTLTFVTPKDYMLAMSPADLQRAVEKAAGRAMRVKITAVDVATASRPIAAPAPRPAAGEGEDAARALDHPEVKRFQETFPASQVRAVRNLKE